MMQTWHRSCHRKEKSGEDGQFQKEKPSFFTKSSSEDLRSIQIEWSYLGENNYPNLHTDE